jgi:hypothetical protein
MYGQLPSYVLANATTFDILVTNSMINHERRIANGNTSPEIPELTQEQMKAMIKSVKGNQ